MATAYLLIEMDTSGSAPVVTDVFITNSEGCTMTVEIGRRLFATVCSRHGETYEAAFGSLKTEILDNPFFQGLRQMYLDHEKRTEEAAASTQDWLNREKDQPL